MHPHAAYTAYTKGLQHRHTYIMRTIPDIADLLKALETSIRNDLLSAIFNGYLCSDNERELSLYLPSLVA